jgi:hypothetical protein
MVLLNVTERQWMGNGGAKAGGNLPVSLGTLGGGFSPPLLVALRRLVKESEFVLEVIVIDYCPTKGDKEPAQEGSPPKKFKFAPITSSASPKKIPAKNQ